MATRTGSVTAAKSDARGFDSRVKLAELTSGVGALVLGVGIGVYASRVLADSVAQILLSGIALHAWGMRDKHRLERRDSVQPVWWSTALYWVCWLMLGAIIVRVLV